MNLRSQARELRSNGLENDEIGFVLREEGQEFRQIADAMAGDGTQAIEERHHRLARDRRRRRVSLDDLPEDRPLAQFHPHSPYCDLADYNDPETLYYLKELGIGE